jgi:hypothetical protein
MDVRRHRGRGRFDPRRYEQRGEFAAAVELRRRFPGITDNVRARECVRTIAGWKPMPLRRVKRMPKVPRLRRML